MPPTPSTPGLGSLGTVQSQSPSASASSSPPGQQPQNPGNIPANVAQTYQNLGQTANAVGSASGLAVPGAAQFQAEMYNPGLNQTQQSFLNNAMNLQGTQEQNLLNGTLAHQFAGVPGMSGSELAIGSQMALQSGQQALNTALPLYQQNQQLAAQNLPNVLTNPITAAQDAAQAANSEVSMSQNLYNSPFQLADSILGGSPFVPSSTIVPPAQVGTGGGKK